MEYELSFNNFNYKKVIQNLKKVKGVKVHGMVPFKVSYFYLSGETDFKKGFVRVRNDHNSVTITTKIRDSKYPTEYEAAVNTTYEDMVNIIKNAGLVLKIQTLKFREKWEVKGCNEVVFDIWPGLPLIMEVDCKSEAGLIALCSKLGLDHKTGYTQNKYSEAYGMDNKITENITNLVFHNFKALLSAHIIKNKALFDKLTLEYYKKFLSKKYHNLLYEKK